MNTCRAADDGGGIFHVTRRDGRRRAGDDDDGVVAGLVVDEDESGAGRLLGGPDDMRVDALVLPGRKANVAERIPADPRDEVDGAADAGRGHRLVRALAARPHLEAGAGDGLADRRHAPGAEGEIRNEDAEDGDAALSP